MQENASYHSNLSASNSSRASVVSLNLISSLSRSILTDLLQNALKYEKVAENLMQQYKAGKSLRSQVEETKKIMTAVILFKCGQSVLDGKVLEIVEEK